MARKKPIYTPDMDPRSFPPVDPEIYEKMGDANVIRMIEDFYRQLSQSAINHMFPSGEENLMKAAHRSADFYIQLLGGPPRYNEKYGNPMLRKRHFSFEISEHERLIWANCFYFVLEEAEEKYDFPAEYLRGFRRFIDFFSKWMVNTTN